MKDTPEDKRGFIVSAPWRSSGKTMLSIGLAREARRRSLSVQTYKKGPDYIDPLWLKAASGRGCYNLDPWLQQQHELLATFHNNTTAGSLSLVEGTMGLHDGLHSDGSDSNAAIAKLLNLPVILVVDCRGMHRTVAALVNGIAMFDSQVRFAGVVLNRVRSNRHVQKIETALQDHCEMPLLGAIPETKSIEIAEKQLGLVPAPQCADQMQQIDAIGQLVADNCDLSVLFDSIEPAQAESVKPAVSGIPQYTIGIAMDEAFHFSYQDDLDTFAGKGIKLVPVSPLRDELPDNLDGLIIGGGFPERFAAALAANSGFRNALRRAIGQGLVVHAECAGLMYLCRGIRLGSEVFDMVGVFDAEISMREKPVGRGYVTLRRLSDNRQIAAHEFHHSQVIFSESMQHTFAVERGYGIDGKVDGIQFRNAQASYAHFRHTNAYPWIDEFIARVALQKAELQAG